jgi:hypothetical protein
MQLFTRDATTGKKLNTIASTLSLAFANYKPIPQLPTSDQISTLVNVTSGRQLTAGEGSSSSSSLSQQTFQLKTASNTTTTSTDDDNKILNDTNEWGQASILYVAQETPNSRVAATSATIGPGKCPIQTEYTPVGGWSNLPAPEFAAFDPVMANVYRYRQQQGVNLGAW